MFERVGLGLVASFLCVGLGVAQESSEVAREKEFKGAIAVSQALKALVEAPANPSFLGRGIGDSERSYLRSDFYLGCPEAIDFLTRTRADVDDSLLKLVRSAKELRVRDRALRILAKRGNEATGA